jgi:hypothetical protein
MMRTFSKGNRLYVEDVCGDVVAEEGSEVMEWEKDAGLSVCLGELFRRFD